MVRFFVCEAPPVAIYVRAGGASQPDASVTQSAQPLNVGADTFAKKSVLPDIAPVPSKNSNAEAAGGLRHAH